MRQIDIAITAHNLALRQLDREISILKFRRWFSRDAALLLIDKQEVRAAIQKRIGQLGEGARKKVAA